MITDEIPTIALGAILREWLCQNDIEPEFPSARRNDRSATAQSGLRTSAAQTPSPIPANTAPTAPLAAESLNPA